MDNYFDGDYTIAREHGVPRVEYPFGGEGDTKTIILRRPMIQLRDRYVPLALGGQDEDYEGAYLVSEDVHGYPGMGLMEWERVYARIPASRTEWRSYVWTVPGIIGTASGLGRLDVTVYWVGTYSVRVEFSAVHGLILGQSFYLWRYILDHGQLRPISSLVVVSEVDSSTIVTARVPQQLYTPINGTGTSFVLKSTPRRGVPQGRNVTARVVYDYFLPGVSRGIASASDIPLAQEFRAVVTATGEEVNILSAATTPTAEEYGGWISAGAEVVAEQSLLRRWMGNIWERQTVYVQAV